MIWALVGIISINFPVKSLDIGMFLGTRYQDIRLSACYAFSCLKVFLIECMSKKINLPPAASCPPCALNVAGAYNVNSSFGSGCLRLHLRDVVGVRPDALDRT